MLNVYGAKIAFYQVKTKYYLSFLSCDGLCNAERRKKTVKCVRGLNRVSDKYQSG